MSNNTYTNHKEYIIRLTPMGSYYFGDDNSDDMASYIVKSLKFPQQTSLLGMLRFLILRHSKDAFDIAQNKIIDKKLAAKLIGKTSFNLGSDPKDLHWGKIKSIGTCFLQNKDASLIFQAPFDNKLYLNFDRFTEATYNGVKKKLPIIALAPIHKCCLKNIDYGYKAKYSEHLYKCFIDSQNNQYSEIFIEDNRIGINISKDGKAEKGLYKQQRFCLKEGFCFVFTAELDITHKEMEEYKNKVVELGGDSSRFRLEIIENTPNVNMIPIMPFSEISSNIHRLVLTAESFIDNEIVGKSIFSIAQTTPFKFLHFDLETSENYSKRSDTGMRSDRFSLFKRGSVFYFDNKNKLEEFQDALNESIFTTIGYNKFQ